MIAICTVKLDLSETTDRNRMMLDRKIALDSMMKYVQVVSERYFA